MKKAEMVSDLKKSGLNIAEDSLKMVIEQVFIFAERAMLDGGIWIKMLLPILPLIKRTLLKAVDKIDGEEG